MYAVLKTGGKQYRVETGDLLRVEKLPGAAGETVEFTEILMLGGDAPQIGTPLIDGASVRAEVIDQIKSDKVITFVKRRRKHGSQRRRGHRQPLTLLKITEIMADGAGKAARKKAAKSPQAAVEPVEPAPLDVNPEAKEA
jgi:large subunit ribosomal protein L21